MNVKNPKLLQARQRLELTQAETAKRSEITVRAYQKYENEGQVPKATTAIDIAKALDTTVEKLWGRK